MKSKTTSKFALPKFALPQFISSLLSAVASPMTVGLAVTACMTWLAMEFYANQHHPENVSAKSLGGILDQIHRKTIDFRMMLRGEHHGSDRVAILAIDDESIEREGRWPWPREKIGRLIENAIDGGAKIVAFDVVFSEADQNSSSPTLKKLKNHISKMGKEPGKLLTPELNELLDKEIEAGNADKRLGGIVGLYQDSVVMGTYYDGEAHDGTVPNPLKDYCVDAHYGRTFEKKYWEKEQIFPIIIDKTVSDELTSKPPLPLLERAALSITEIEALHATYWFEGNAQARERVLEALREIEVTVPTEAIPILFVSANIGDEQTVFEILSGEESLKRFANRPMILQIFSTILHALSPPELAGLRQVMRKNTMEYCRRFLTPSDELLNRDQFIKAIADQPKEVQEEVWQSRGLEPAWDELLKTNAKLATPITLADAIAQWTQSALRNRVEVFEKSWINIPDIATPTKHTGYFNASLDPDGTVRKSRLIARRGHIYIPSLALKTFLLDQGYRARFTIDREDLRAASPRKGVQSLEFIDKDDAVKLTAPVDSQGRLMINYAGPQQMFDYISAASLLTNDDRLQITRRVVDPGSGVAGMQTQRVMRKDFLKNKILIVGATSIGVFDLRQVPFEENYPGVETHANMLSNLLTEDAKAKGEAVKENQPGFLRIHPLEENWMWLAILVCGILFSAVLTYLDSVAGLGATVLTLFGIYALDRYVVFASGYVANVSLPIISAFAIFVAITFYKYFTEERNKRELKGTFAKYVSPAVVDEILKNPANIELGGKKMELTVMFSDVRGFTTISEKLDPRALSDLLNSYLTPMTDLVFETKGTLDKYMGDAIMAFWGAPIHFEEHAHNAARCALLMLKRLKVLQDEYKSKGLPTIDIGIGLNTGDMSVGGIL